MIVRVLPIAFALSLACAVTFAGTIEQADSLTPLIEKALDEGIFAQAESLASRP